jgi:CDP-6-deoxy-D-xylo-4-hexulose-3-dehydrase
MLFAGNLTRQPAITALVEDARARGAPEPYRVVGELTRTDVIMNQSFWLGVYPGLTEPMLEYIVRELRAFVKRA